MTNLSEGQEVAPKSGAVKKANPALALFVSRDQHIEFLALSHLLLRECEDPFRKLAHRAYTLWRPHCSPGSLDRPDPKTDDHVSNSVEAAPS